MTVKAMRLSMTALCFLALGSLPITSEAQSGTIYEIKAVHNDKCIDIEGSSQSNGALAWVRTCNNGLNQRYRLENVFGNFFKISPVHSQGKCLDVKSADHSPGRNIQQYSCHGGTNQQWEKIPDGTAYVFKVSHSGHCLEAETGGFLKRRDLLEQNFCDQPATNPQRWKLIVKAQCGNTLCESSEGETASNCQADCGAVCGNTFCESGETPSNCPADCFGSMCPNGLCESGEACSNCPEDCGGCLPLCNEGASCTSHSDCGGTGQGFCDLNNICTCPF